MKPLLLLSKSTSYCETVRSLHEALPYPPSDRLHDRDGKHGDLVRNQGVCRVLTIRIFQTASPRHSVRFEVNWPASVCRWVVAAEDDSKKLC